MLSFAAAAHSPVQDGAALNEWRHYTVISSGCNSLHVVSLTEEKNEMNAHAVITPVK